MPQAAPSRSRPLPALDFGLCVPTIKFEAGLNGRQDTEFTFQAIDSLVNKGQQEALNPNIITNRVCDQADQRLQAANAAAKTTCLDAKAKIAALGTKDASTANTWNTLLGFDGTDINPDNASSLASSATLTKPPSLAKLVKRRLGGWFNFFPWVVSSTRSACTAALALGIVRVS